MWEKKSKWDTTDTMLAGLAVVLGFAIPYGNMNAEPGVKITAGIFFTLFLMLLVYFVYASRHHGPRAAIEKDHRGGSQLAVLSEPEDSSDGEILIGNARMPRSKEAQHTIIEGATGAGKTQAIKQMMQAARDRGDTLVVVDSNYELFKTFGRPGDVILSPLDEKGLGWSPLNEVRTNNDWGLLGNSFIGEGAGDARTWNGMARTLFAAVARGYHRECERARRRFDVNELFGLLTSADAEVIAPLLEGTSVATLAQGDGRGLNNVRMSLIEALASWPELKEGDFSLRDWIEKEDRPSIFIPYRKRDLPLMKNLISAWLDQIILAAIDAGASDKRTWLVIDELAGLGEIGGLLTGAAELRKPGFRILAGLQDYTQLRSLYGHDRAATLLNNLSNKVFLRATDDQVADRMSRSLGDQRVLITSRSNTAGGGGSSVSTSYRDDVERVVIASELMSLPDLTAFVKFSGDAAIKKTTIPFFETKPTEIPA